MEEKLHRHPAVFDACVYGVRHHDGTQGPATAIALRRGSTVTRDELKCELNAMLDQEEQLERVAITGWDEFPFGVTDKTLKRIFRERS